MTAYIFPGQGSQYPGMAKDIYENDKTAQEYFNRANDILGFSITDIMFNGSDEELKRTDVTQPAIFLHSVIMAKCMSDFAPDMVAGHSLGEFSALVSSGAIDFEAGLELVATRARAMQKACEITPGIMAAVIGAEPRLIEDICSKIDGTVVPANYNSDNQIVISGSVDAVNEACIKLKESGARRTLPLSVGGAFHSPLMQYAAEELSLAIERVPFKEPMCPIYQNVTALSSTDPAEIKANLLSQLTSPVRWSQTIRNMAADGADTFIEIGPGKVLQGLISKILF